MTNKRHGVYCQLVFYGCIIDTLDFFKDRWYCIGQDKDTLSKYVKSKGHNKKYYMEPSNKISTEVAQNSVDPVSFFDLNNDFVLAYKKTEKLASAVYMVTGLFSENEPVKWTLRKKVGELLSFILTYKDTPEAGRADFLYTTKTKALELVSLLEISLRGGLMSQMNFSILKQEFLNLVSILNVAVNSSNDFPGEGLSKTFFDVGQINSQTLRDGNNTDRFYKTTEIGSGPQRMSLNDLKDKTVGANTDNFKKSNRQNVILALLKKKKELTIKDIALVIKDCSEKTIQRELNSFITLGILKREGVRRWSKYSLV